MDIARLRQNLERRAGQFSTSELCFRYQKREDQDGFVSYTYSDEQKREATILFTEHGVFLGLLDIAMGDRADPIDYDSLPLDATIRSALRRSDPSAIVWADSDMTDWSQMPMDLTDAESDMIAEFEADDEELFEILTESGEFEPDDLTFLLHSKKKTRPKRKPPSPTLVIEWLASGKPNLIRKAAGIVKADPKEEMLPHILKTFKEVARRGESLWQTQFDLAKTMAVYRDETTLDTLRKAIDGDILGHTIALGAAEYAFLITALLTGDIDVEAATNRFILSDNLMSRFGQIRALAEWSKDHDLPLDRIVKHSLEFISRTPKSPFGYPEMSDIAQIIINRGAIDNAHYIQQAIEEFDCNEDQTCHFETAYKTLLKLSDVDLRRVTNTGSHATTKLSEKRYFERPELPEGVIPSSEDVNEAIADLESDHLTKIRRAANFFLSYPLRKALPALLIAFQTALKKQNLAWEQIIHLAKCIAHWPDSEALDVLHKAIESGVLPRHSAIYGQTLRAYMTVAMSLSVVKPSDVVAELLKSDESIGRIGILKSLVDWSRTHDVPAKDIIEDSIRYLQTDPYPIMQFQEIDCVLSILENRGRVEDGEALMAIRTALESDPNERRGYKDYRESLKDKRLD